MSSDAPRGGWFWTSTAIGWAAIAFGLTGLLRADIDWIGFATWFVGGAVVHDVLIAPLVFAAAWLVTRALPPTIAIPVKVGLATSALTVLYAWPLLRGYGRSAALPSALPLDYGRNLTIALLVIWSVVAIWAVERHFRAPRNRA
jgi:hypothetical protein